MPERDQSDGGERPAGFGTQDEQELFTEEFAREPLEEKPPRPNPYDPASSPDDPPVPTDEEEGTAEYNSEDALREEKRYHDRGGRD